MLAELAAINSAYAVIKEVISNGKELTEAGAHISSFFFHKHTLEKKVKITPQQETNLMDEFFALEEARRKEKELRDIMLIAGRPGLLEDWDRFQKKAALAAQNAERERVLAIMRQREEREEMVIIACIGILFLIFATAIFGSVYAFSR
jgi:hypothetical protein